MSDGAASAIGAAEDAAVRRAAELLGFEEGRALGSSEVSVALRCLAVDAIEKELGPIAELRPRLTEEERERAAAIARRTVGVTTLRTLASHPRVLLPTDWLGRALSDDLRAEREEFLRRVSDAAVERVVTEPAAPELCIALGDALGPAASADVLPGRLNIGVVFAATHGFTSELHTLIVDASDGNVGSDGRPLVNVVGVRVDWLGPGNTARRAILEDGQGGLVETDLSPPLAFDAVLFLCLGQSERASHRELSDRLSEVVRLNAYDAAALCDDKLVTHVRLRAAGVTTPPCMLVETASDPASVTRSINLFLGEAGGTRLVAQPRYGTEGEGVTAFEWSSSRRSEIVNWLVDLQAEHGDIVVRPLVGNVRFGASQVSADLRINVVWNGDAFVAESGYLQVAGSPSQVASSIGRGGRIVKLSEGALEEMGIGPAELSAALLEATRAAAALCCADNPCTIVGIDVKLERGPEGTKAWVLDVNPRPSGLGYSEFFDTHEPGVTRQLWRSLVRRCALARTMRILRRDLDDRPEDVLFAVDADCLFDAVREIRSFLREGADSLGPNAHLLHERGILVLGATLWRMRDLGVLPPRNDLEEILADVSDSRATREQMLEAIEKPPGGAGDGEDGYLSYMNQFLGAVNEQEMQDFRLAKEALASRMPRRPSASLTFKDPGRLHRALSPMRVGISSANASDNWTFSKLRGGVVLNFAVDLAAQEVPTPGPPVSATVEVIEAPVLVVETESPLETDRPIRAVIGRGNVTEFFAAEPGTHLAPETCFKDIKDPLLLLKYALVFTGIVGFREDPAAYVADPRRVLRDLARFTGRGGLRLTVRSTGPSRAGFASSSCVALCLLRALYGASGQDELTQPSTLSSLALLLENEVGLKSGKQDTDGPLYPGVKAIKYPPTGGFLESDLEVLAVDERALRENLVLVNSGIQRPAANGLRRGLNMRHYAYVSRDPKRFAAVMKSLDVHERIVDAVLREDWPRLGSLFTEYLDLRERIDPGATHTVFDEAAGRKILRYPLEYLLGGGLIYGGMYAGAMGGGVLLLVPTPLGKEPDVSGTTRLLAAVETLRGVTFGPVKPFARLHAYDYAINTRGLEYQEMRTFVG
jgi:galactokinase/mevalonate kinase-like predicted kinase/glutathione synthase/RimK-type ligase-like ATP-grasp enzyme